MALIQAVRQGHVRGIKLLISNGDTLALKSNVLGTTALIEACKFDEKVTAKKMITVLLKNGASVNDRDYLGRNALHWSCYYGNIDVTNTLLSAHAPSERIDLAMADYEGNSILHFAVLTGKCSFIRYVCKLYRRYQVTDWNRNKDGFSAAELAVNLGHKHCAVMVQEICSSDEFSDTPSSISRSDNEGGEAILIQAPDSTKKKYLELPLLEQGKAKSDTRYQTTRAVEKFKDRIRRRPEQREEVKIVPLSNTQRKLSEEIIGKISYRNLLQDMNWIQAIQSSSSYRQGVDESVRLQRLQIAANHVVNTDFTKSNGKNPTNQVKHKKRNQKDVPHHKMSRRKVKDVNNNINSKNEVGKNKRKNEK